MQSQGCSAKMSEIPQHFLKYQLLLEAAPDRRKTVPTFAGGFSLCPCVGLDGMEFHGWDLGAENAPRGVSHWLEPQAGFFGFCTEKFPFGSDPKHGMRRFRKFWEFFGAAKCLKSTFSAAELGLGSPVLSLYPKNSTSRH